MSDREILDKRYQETRDYTLQVIEQAIADPDLPLLDWHLAVAEKDLKYLSVHLEESMKALSEEQLQTETRLLEKMWQMLEEAEGLQAERHHAELKTKIKQLKEGALKDPTFLDKFKK
jgi:hypothetical protein